MPDWSAKRPSSVILGRGASPPCLQKRTNASMVQQSSNIESWRFSPLLRGRAAVRRHHSDTGRTLQCAGKWQPDRGSLPPTEQSPGIRRRTPDPRTSRFPRLENQFRLPRRRQPHRASGTTRLSASLLPADGSWKTEKIHGCRPSRTPLCGIGAARQLYDTGEKKTQQGNKLARAAAGRRRDRDAATGNRWLFVVRAETRSRSGDEKPTDNPRRWASHQSRLAAGPPATSTEPAALLEAAAAHWPGRG
mmetsp:Transcript_51789/g.117841  ORF Transcript_51789/g.117841 Transcript_51789/m.117841 type:complete len:248 (-) Transcript_51789:75-818(-)